MFACPFLEGFSEHFGGLYLRFSIIAIAQAATTADSQPSLFLESHFIEIMTPQRDGGSISCFVQRSPRTCTSGTVTFVPGSLPSPILLLLRTMFAF